MNRARMILLLVLLCLLPARGHALLADHQCAYCHVPHGALGDPLLLDGGAEAVCLSCHGPGGMSVLKADVHNLARSDYRRITCLQCHDPHDNLDNMLGPDAVFTGTNIKLVGTLDPASSSGLAAIQVVNFANQSGGSYAEIAFESRGTDAGDPAERSFNNNTSSGGNPGSRVCEVCHSGNHNAGRTCTICHTHLSGFSPP